MTLSTMPRPPVSHPSARTARSAPGGERMPRDGLRATQRATQFATQFASLGAARDHLLTGVVIAIAIPVIAMWSVWPMVADYLRSAGLVPHWPDLSVLARRSLAVQVHVAGAVTALLLGPLILWGPKGTPTHKALGRVWALAMALTCVTSFFIKSFMPLAGQFGLIHLLSIWTAYSLPKAIWDVRRGNSVAHQKAMQGLYWGLVIAGAMTFIPGRTLFHMVFN